ncbi:MAG: Ig-like domain-containing protein [Polyangiaceae bacterium]
MAIALQACGGGGSTVSNGGAPGAAGAPAVVGASAGGNSALGSAGDIGSGEAATSAGSSGAPSAMAGDGGASSVGAAGSSTSAGAGAGGASGSAGAGANAGAGGSSCSASGGVVTATDLAFPEAEGFGRHATGGRGGKVYHVTNLNDSGSGSFRDAVSQSNRIVVFDVGGYIPLKSAVSVRSNLTIAGQTAPGGGIGFRGGELGFASSSNIICRHVRVRPGSETTSDTDDALSLFRAHNVILDHSSFEFAPWNNIDGVSDDWQNNPVTDITFQDSMIANPTGQQFGAHTESVGSQWSWYRNVFANSHNRNPLAKVNTVFVNNVLYNYSAGYTTHTSTSFKHDLVNNYFIFGPASTGTDNTWFQVDQNQSIYYSGNLKDNDLNGALNGAATTPYWYQGTGTVLSAPWSTVSTTPYTAPSAYRIAVSQAGALPRDPIDALVVSQLRTLGKGTTGTGANSVGPGSGLYTSQTQTGLSNNGYGDMVSGTPPADADNDGMPDFWEKAAGSDPATDDAMHQAPDGYVLIEHYLNWLAEPHALTSAGMSVDVNLASLNLGFSDVSPTFTVTQPGCGSVQLQSDGHTARYTPPTGFMGIASFNFTVKGSDGTSYTGHVAVAAQ